MGAEACFWVYEPGRTRAFGPYDSREFASGQTEGRMCLLVEMPKGGEVKVVGVNEIALSVSGRVTTLEAEA